MGGPGSGRRPGSGSYVKNKKVGPRSLKTKTKRLTKIIGIKATNKLSSEWINSRRSIPRAAKQLKSKRSKIPAYWKDKYS